MSNFKQGLDKYLTTSPEDGSDDDGHIFYLFVGDDENRPYFLSPFIKDGIMYATDTLSAIRCDENKCVTNLSNQEDAPINVAGVFPLPNMRIKLDIDKTIFEQCKTEDEYRYVGKDVACKECDGSGQVEWTYRYHKQDLDCPKCDGDGLSERKQSVPTGNKTFGIHFVKVCNAYIRVHLFYRLIEAQELIDDDIYITYYQEPDKGLMFQIGAFDILLMPSNVTDFDLSEHIVIDVLGANLNL